MRFIPKENLNPEIQKHLRDYEAGYDLAQASIRRAAAIWILAPFAALAVLMTDQHSQAALANAQYSFYFLLTTICFLGTIGLFILWVVDQMVYQSLLHSIFVLGIRVEHLNNELVPIRTLLYTTKHNISWKLSIFYAVPIVFLTIIPPLFSFLTIYAEDSNIIPNYKAQNLAANIMLLIKVSIFSFILVRPHFESLERRYARNYGEDFSCFMQDRGLRKRELTMVSAIPPPKKPNKTRIQ